MLEPLLTILFCYVVGVGLVHVAYMMKVVRNADRKIESWVVITYNHEHCIEWVLRSLLFINWIYGRSAHVIIIDRGSTDETVDIIQRLSIHRLLQLVVVRASDELERALYDYTGSGVVKVLDLERMEDKSYHHIRLEVNHRSESI